MDLRHACEVLESINQSGGERNADQCIMFWSADMREGSTTNTLICMLALCGAYYSGEERSSALSDLVNRITAWRPSPNDQLDESGMRKAEALLCSVYFLSLFRVPTFTSSTLGAALNKVNHFLSLDNNPKDFVEDLSRMHKAPTDAHIVGLVDACAACVPLPASLQTVHKACHLTSSMIFEMLRNSLHVDATAKLVLDNVLVLLRHPLISDTRIFALLFMMRSFIAAAPVVPPETLEACVRQVKTYFLRPKPFGDIARQMLELLALEQRAPGDAFRQAYRDAMPDLVLGGVRTGRERNVHVIFDRDAAGPRALADTLHAGAVASPDVRHVQHTLLGNLFQRVLSTDVSRLLERLSADALANCYSAANDVVENSVLMADGAQCSDFLRRSLRTLLQAIEKQANGEPVRCAFAGAPPLNFQFSHVAPDVAAPSSNSTQADVHHEGSDSYPARRECRRALQAIIGEYAAAAEAAEATRGASGGGGGGGDDDGGDGARALVRIGVSGGDEMLHMLVQAWVALRWSKPKLFVHVDVRFYVLYGGPCQFAEFLGHYDAWYARHVLMGAIACTSMWPRVAAGSQATPVGAQALQQQQQQVQESGCAVTENGHLAAYGQFSSGGISPHGPVTPPLVLRHQLESYFRDASHCLHVNLYRCECWLPDASVSGPSSFVLPFCSRVEVGVRAAAQRQRAGMGGAARSVPLDELIASKQVKFNGTTLTMRHTCMNSFGFTRSGDAWAPKSSFYSVAIANHWSEADAGRDVHGDPSKPWLELYVTDWDSRKKKTAPLNFHISVVEMENDKKPFDVVVDGCLYGPFSRVRILPLESDSGEGDNMTLPVMTFFPLASFINNEAATQ